MNLKRVNKILLYGSFALYFLMLFWIVILKLANYDRIIGCASYLLQNDLLTRLVDGFKDILNPSWYFKNVGTYLNILIFISLGIYLPIIFKRNNIIKDALIGLLLILVFETLQLFSGLGTFSIIDMIANIFGVIIGLVITKITNLINKPVAINVLCIAMFIILLPVTIYAYTMVFINIRYYQDFPWFGLFEVGPSLDHFDFPIN